MPAPFRPAALERRPAGRDLPASLLPPATAPAPPPAALPTPTAGPPPVPLPAAFYPGGGPTVDGYLYDNILALAGGIGGAAPQTFTISDHATGADDPSLRPPWLYLDHLTDQPPVPGIGGSLTFRGEDSAHTKVEVTKLCSEITQVTPGAIEATLAFCSMHQNHMCEVARTRGQLGMAATASAAGVYGFVGGQLWARGDFYACAPGEGKAGFGIIPDPAGALIQAQWPVDRPALDLRGSWNNNLTSALTVTNLDTGDTLAEIGGSAIYYGQGVSSIDFLRYYSAAGDPVYRMGFDGTMLLYSAGHVAFAFLPAAAQLECFAVDSGGTAQAVSVFQPALANTVPATWRGRYLFKAGSYQSDPQAGGGIEVIRIEVLTGPLPAIGFLGHAAAGVQTLPAAATDAATTQTLANSLRSALIAFGLGA